MERSAAGAGAVHMARAKTISKLEIKNRIGVVKLSDVIASVGRPQKATRGRESSGLFGKVTA
jgi:hypothetical protein